jgi:hypothetical protein
LASVSQGWRAASVARLRGAAAGRAELRRECNSVAGMGDFACIVFMMEYWRWMVLYWCLSTAARC